MSGFENDFDISSLAGLIEILVDGRKSIVSLDTFKGKVIGLYFSAHWCGPCRRFTPILAAKYKEFVDAGHAFDIIFISADESDVEAENYFSDMPWKMLSFSATEEIRNLNEKFEVDGIPTLVLIDENGNLISKDGTRLISQLDFHKLKNYAAIEKEAKLELARKKANFTISEIFKSASILDKDSKVVSADEVTGKIIGLYFSAHWCPPCRGFTPILADRIRELKSAGHAIEIVFVSSDQGS